MNKYSHTTSIQIVLVYALFISSCGIEAPQNPVPDNTQRLPTKTITSTPSITPVPSATFTPEPSPTSTPIPRIVLLPPVSPDCTGPTLIRANGAYNGIVPSDFDSAMAPAGSGRSYQGHSDFERPRECTDDGVYAPASGRIIEWYKTNGVRGQGVLLVLDPGVLIQLNPDNSQEYTAAINYWLKKNNYGSRTTLRIAHISKVHDIGRVSAGDLIGYLAYEANEPMVSYSVAMSTGPKTIWSPVLFSWTIQPICLQDCAMKLNNYYKQP